MAYNLRTRATNNYKDTCAPRLPRAESSLAWPHPFPQEREGVWPRETTLPSLAERGVATRD